VEVRDVMLPGELSGPSPASSRLARRARRRWSATRAEIAALRSLANAGRMLDDNPACSSCGSSMSWAISRGNTVVFGAPDAMPLPPDRLGPVGQDAGPFPGGAGGGAVVSGGALRDRGKYRLAAAPDPRVLASHGRRPTASSRSTWSSRPAVAASGGSRGGRARSSIEFTRKTHLRDLVREELEHEIDAAAYADYLTEADPGRSPIRKVRHVVPHGDQRLEVDVFDQPPGLVLVEVELRSETELVDLPD